MKKNLMLLFLIGIVIFFSNFYVKIGDLHSRVRKLRVEYVVFHYTANDNDKATAIANANYLLNKKNAGAHWIVDEKNVVEGVPENRVSYSVADNYWAGFIPKPWLKEKVSNGNTINYEACLRSEKFDSKIIDVMTELQSRKLVSLGLDVSRLIRHHDVTGKHCPVFYYNTKTVKTVTKKRWLRSDIQQKVTEIFWDQKKEDKAFEEYKKIVSIKMKYYKIDYADRKNHNYTLYEMNIINNAKCIILDNPVTWK
jgi:N-acetylmuramoyl-L-alanine amidase CwlA